MKSTLPFLWKRASFLRSALASALIIAYLASCSLQDHTPIGNKYLISSEFIGDVTKEELAVRLAALNLPAQLPPQALLLYNLKVYKIVYKTKNPAGKEVNASGALLVPQTGNNLSLISQQHGTILSDADAPSHYAPTSEAYSFASIFASNGFIISCPDYLGYGESGDGKNPFLHTYEHREGLAQASLDMLRAAKEFIAENNSIKWDSKVYLTGYSEGGFATMALYKKLQDDFPSEFNIKAVTTGAGAYDKTSFMKVLLTTPTHGISAYNSTYLWVLLTYNNLYGINRPLDYYFVEPYLTQIKALGLFANLNVSFDQILTSTFKQGVIDGTDTQFLAAVADNNVYDWKPTKPLQLYHGTEDPQVFFLNSENANQAMTGRGADAVQLIPIPGGNHQTSLPTYVLGSYQFIKANP